jgi:N6-adenosine-specific RNA methylase IME4
MAERYRTIVADPPWHYGSTGYSYGASDRRGKSGAGAVRAVGLPYRTLSIDEIAALPVRTLADPDGAHLYLWTTQAYLRDAFAIAEAWGFEPATTLVWCKRPMGFMGGVYGGSSTEFCVFATSGKVEPLSRVLRQWFEWPRGAPSERTGRKPDAFLDMVEQVSPGPYVELFARRARFGWDYWGDESLGTATMGHRIAEEYVPVADVGDWPDA